MRVSDFLVVQQVDRVVVVTDDAGGEAALTFPEIPPLMNRLVKAHQDSAHAVWLGDTGPGLEGDAPVAILNADFVGAAFALGYFWRGQ